MSKQKPSPLKLNSEEELLSDTTTTSASTSRRSSGGQGGNLAYLASRRNSLSPKALVRRQRHQRQRRQSNFLELPVLDYGKNNARKHRLGSLPIRCNHSSDTDDEDSNLDATTTALMYRLRTFNIKDNRVVNTGDELLPRGRRSRQRSKSPTASSRNSPVSSCCNSNNSMESVYSDVSGASGGDFFFAESNKYRVAMMGHTGVGKTALVTQFMTSEYINTYDASLDDEFGERTISILLDDEESELVFIDHPSAEMSPENALATYNPHCCIVVYSITDRHSYTIAEEILRYLWSGSNTKAVILVGNKCDLERAREVASQEARTLATTYSAKFIETSAGLQHNVDELLVGSLKQCRLRTTMKIKKKKNYNFSDLAWDVLRKLVQAEDYLMIKKSKSCINLHVL